MNKEETANFVDTFIINMILSLTNMGATSKF
jgi:hypothetical protein